MRKFFLLGVLFLFFIIIRCDDNKDSNSPTPTPEPTNTPGYASIRCNQVVTCADASSLTDYCVKDGAWFQNYGNIAGSAYAGLYIQQPYGNTIGSWNQEVYLNPGDSIYLEHVFCEPTWAGGDVYCWCTIY